MGRLKMGEKKMRHNQNEGVESMRLENAGQEML